MVFGINLFTSWPPWAVDREFFIFCFLLVAVLGSGTHLQSFLDEFRFVLSDYELKWTHGDMIRVNFCVFHALQLAGCCLMNDAS